jgi:hypothetical protein
MCMMFIASTLILKRADLQRFYFLSGCLDKNEEYLGFRRRVMVLALNGRGAGARCAVLMGMKKEK